MPNVKCEMSNVKCEMSKGKCQMSNGDVTHSYRFFLQRIINVSQGVTAASQRGQSDRYVICESFEAS